MIRNFEPPRTLRNPHLQSILASVRLRKLLLGKQALWLKWESNVNILRSSEGSRILGRYRPSHWNKQLVILLHGWEGGDNSTYIMSAAVKLAAKGASVMRLNLRDHGETHYLNRDLFHSARLGEMVDAVVETVKRYPHEEVYLVGYSLGANFALRITAKLAAEEIKPAATVAVCPVVDPASTMERLATGTPLYHRYFVKKWKRSLRKKLALYPDLGYGDALKEANTLSELNNFFVPGHTPYNTPEEYFNAYALNDQTLAGLKTPCHLIVSGDDPICPASDIRKLPDNPKLIVERTDHGGHCGFIEDYKLNSWVDRRLGELVFTG